MSAFQGWTCSTCGAFVPNGCTHSCPTTAYGTKVFPPQTYATDPLVRIADALERIADALDREATP